MYLLNKVMLINETKNVYKNKNKKKFSLSQFVNIVFTKISTIQYSKYCLKKNVFLVLSTLLTPTTITTVY